MLVEDGMSGVHLGVGIPEGMGMDEGVSMSRGEYQTSWTWDLGYPSPRRDLEPEMPIPLEVTLRNTEWLEKCTAKFYIYENLQHIMMFQSTSITFYQQMKYQIFQPIFVFMQFPSFHQKNMASSWMMLSDELSVAT